MLSSEQGLGLQQGLGNLWEGRLCRFCGQPAPVPHCKPCLPCVQSETPPLQVTGHSLFCHSSNVLYIAEKVSQVLGQREKLGCFIF